MHDEMKAVKLKALPKIALEKKPIKVTPLSNDPALQLALKMQNNQISEINSDSEDWFYVKFILINIHNKYEVSLISLIGNFMFMKLKQ